MAKIERFVRPVWVAGLALALIGGLAQAAPTVGPVSVFSSNAADYSIGGVTNPGNISSIGGSGQINGDFQIVDFQLPNGQPGQIAIRISRRFLGLAPRADDVYFVDPGLSGGSDFGANTNGPNAATWNFDFHIDLGTDQLRGNTDANPAPNTIDDFDFALDLMFNALGQQTTTLFPLDPTAIFGNPGDVLVQESTNLGFGFFNGGVPGADVFDAFVEGDYTFTLSVASGDTELASVSATARVGDGPPTNVPAPAMVSLMGFGLAGLLAVRRRRR